MTRRRLLLGLLALVLAVAASTTLLARAGAGSESCAVKGEQAEERGVLVSGSGARVLVIGDSYAVGGGVLPDQSWPLRLPGRVRVDGFSGSGFTVGASPCGDVSYATRAARARLAGVDLVVVEGGLNDADQPLADLEAGYERLVRALGDRPVLVVGPPPAPLLPYDDVAAVDATLARLAAARGTPYLSMLDVELSYLPDLLHPDAAGHRVFGDRVAERVRELLR
ncbi:SGNH/GDSL hydrolase family protein [Nocardioides daeguensis]|uniref:SGNH hydrolase-type esterase domain-containing protein n=1 Tax=Nocardioides daeguensis TaxID=908359 RepID=A0ABP6VBQ4_9ACTN|nr:SGNH/GDSL hydrolase family protein [Nocardioides daeguensis]MBV6726032.1 SGNH/GDSL hydrolase family protein [Nocardioides daeguensis]MCR1771875.1 SGNH/GDSL hydrolase family protein [Nocardioides daeguensis]